MRRASRTYQRQLMEDLDGGTFDAFVLCTPSLELQALATSVQASKWNVAFFSTGNQCRDGAQRRRPRQNFRSSTAKKQTTTLLLLRRKPSYLSKAPGTQKARLASSCRKEQSQCDQTLDTRLKISSVYALEDQRLKI